MKLFLIDNNKQSCPYMMFLVLGNYWMCGQHVLYSVTIYSTTFKVNYVAWAKKLASVFCPQMWSIWRKKRQ